MNRMHRMNMHCSSCTDVELPIAVWGNFTKTLKVTMHNLEKCTLSELLFELSFTCNIHLRQGTSSPSPALESGGHRRWRATHAPAPCSRKCQEMSVKRNGTSSFRARMLRPKPKSGFNLQLTWQSVELKLWFRHDLFVFFFETSTQENHLPISATRHCYAIVDTALHKLGMHHLDSKPKTPGENGAELTAPSASACTASLAHSLEMPILSYTI